MPPDNTKEIIMTDKFSAAVTMNSEPAKVWAALTKHELMIQWMGEPEMKPEIHTNRKVNEGILIRGFHHLKFENKGIVISCDKEKKLSYSHLSSLSRLPDKPENYSILEFVLTPVDQQTLLTLFITNFPTETIRKHLEFYWRGTMVKIKNAVEAQMAQ
jgi:uncharacterized protein YndB with AHSA1/START domain